MNAQTKTRHTDLLRFDIDLMIAIATAEGKPIGGTLRSDIEARYGEKINNGRLYPRLNQLADWELIHKSAKNKRANYYELTEQGRAFLKRRKALFDAAVENMNGDGS